MAKEYSEHSFLLEIGDYELVEKYLRGRKPSITSFTYAKPTKSKQNDEEIVTQITAVLHEQSEPVQREVEWDFSRVNNLANDKGTRNLLDEAKDKGVELSTSQAIEMNPYDRALWFFNEQLNIFEQADAVQQFNDLNGWKRVPVPTKTTNSVLAKKDALAEGLKRYFVEKEARGKYCSVEMYAKSDRVYVVARLTDHAESNFEPDDKTGKLNKRGTRRPLFEVYYLYRPQNGGEGDGELEIKARGGWQKQRDLLGVFTKTVFDHELDDTKQTFNLEPLKQPTFSLIADTEDQMEWWWLKSLDLRTPDRLTTITVTVSDDRKRGVDAMWEQLRRLNLDSRVTTMLINRADFQLKFKTYRKRQRGTASFYINWKDSCSLNSIDEFHVKARKVLKKSKLDNGFAQESSQ